MARHPSLDRHPRVELGHWPTPLEPAERLRAAIGGPELWIKRDDCSGLALGGNKVRKLEYLLGRALAEGAHGVVTTGSLQSNHARQTAAACARLGLTCDLVLSRQVPRDDKPYEQSGNILLDRILGATVHVVDDTVATLVRLAELDAEAAADGRVLFSIGPGGSDETGVLGYVRAALELSEQVRALDLDVARIVVAASTAGTAAGLVLGTALAGMGARVDAVCVYEDAGTTADALRRLVGQGAEKLGCAPPPPDRWRVTDDSLGRGYGILSNAARHTIDLVARTEGVVLDPVYTGKAMAQIIADAWASEPDAPATGATLFIHTGGVPAVFAYGSDLGPS